MRSGGGDASCVDDAVFVMSLSGVVAVKKVRTSAFPTASALPFFFRGIVCGARKREVKIFWSIYFLSSVFLIFFVEFSYECVRGRSGSQAKCARRVRGASGGDQHSNYPVTLRNCMTTAFSLSVEAFVVTVASDGASCCFSCSSMKCKASKPSEHGRSNFVIYMKF